MVRARPSKVGFRCWVAKRDVVAGNHFSIEYGFLEAHLFNDTAIWVQYQLRLKFSSPIQKNKATMDIDDDGGRLEAVWLGPGPKLHPP